MGRRLLPVRMLPQPTGQYPSLPSRSLQYQSPLLTLNSRWYFDVASTSSTDETITVAFFVRGPDGVLGANMTSLGTTIVQVSGTMKNGSAYSFQTNASADATAVINVSDNSIYGDWQETGYQFAGTEGGTKWVVSMHDPEHDMFGTITFESVSNDSIFSMVRN
jgi:hypothetical protein